MKRTSVVASAIALPEDVRASEATQLYVEIRIALTIASVVEDEPTSVVTLATVAGWT